MSLKDKRMPFADKGLYFDTDVEASVEELKQKIEELRDRNKLAGRFEYVAVCNICLKHIDEVFG